MSDDNNSCDDSRRSFFGKALAGGAGVGTLVTLYAVKRTADPLPSVFAAGFTKVDVKDIKDGAYKQIVWRGKPVYIIKKVAKDGNHARDLVIGSARYSLGIQLCTHLGCIPNWSESKRSFHCPCHGGEFNASGVNTFGPPPTPMEIPPFSVKGTTLTFGETGPEYQKIVKGA